MTLFGGTFARITSEDAAYPRAALPFRTAYQQADGQLIRRSDITPTLENVAVVSCPHDEIDGITIDVPAQNKIVISGIDKQKVGQFAAEVRGKRPPEPYKGKGIKYTTEVLRHKEGKTGGKK